MAASRPPPTGAVAPRAAIAVAGLILLGTAAWFAGSWIDTGVDSTCGAVVHPSMWLGAGTPKNCGAVMSIRTAITVATAGIGGLLLYTAARKRVIASAAAASILAVTAASAVTMLVVNEAVRSGGAL